MYSNHRLPSLHYLTVQVEDFTDAGKKCRVRLQHQIEKRLPKPSAMDCLPVLLDPATKMFASWLLDDDKLALDTRVLLKEKHAEAYKAWKTNDTAEEADQMETPSGEVGPLVLDMDDGLEDEEDVEEDFDDPGIMLANDESVAGDDDLTDAANDVFEAWMRETPKFGDYLFEGAKPLVPNRTTGRVTFRELVSKFDTMKYYRVSGSVKYPSITMLARIHFSTMLNAAFQERVFSTCKNVMGNNQARLDMDHMEMKALLCQNADLIRKKII